MRAQRSLPVLTLTVFLVTCRGGSAIAAEPVAFEDLKAIFKKHCLTCHNGERPRGGLDMTTKAAILAGSDSGVSLVAGKPEESLLYKLAAHLEAPHMPPNSPRMPDRELEQVRTWIRLGLPERKDLAKLDPKLLASLGKESQGGAGMSAAPVSADGGHPARAKSGLETAFKPTTGAKTAAIALDYSATLGGFLQPSLEGVAVVNDEGQIVRGLAFPEKEITRVRSLNGGQVILIAGGEGAQTGRVRLVQARDGAILFENAEELDTVLAADARLEEGRIALGGPGRTIKTFSIKEGKLLHSMKKHVDWVLDIRFSPDGLLLASADRGGTVMITEAATGTEVFALRGHAGPVVSLAWRTDGNSLLSAGADGKIRVWDAHTGQQIAQHDAHKEGVNQIEVLADGRVLSVGRDKTAKLWTPSLDRCEVLVTASTMPLSLAAKTDRVAVGGIDGSLTFAVLDPNRLTAPVPTPIAKSSATEDAVPMTQSGNLSGTMTESANPGSELARKRALLETLEASAEKLKDEAARSPENKDLAEGYIQVCRAVLALKADIVRIEKLPKSTDGSRK